MAMAWASWPGTAASRANSSATAVSVPVSVAARVRAAYSTQMLGASMHRALAARNSAISHISSRKRGIRAVAAMMTGVPAA